MFLSFSLPSSGNTILIFLLLLLLLSSFDLVLKMKEIHPSILYLSVYLSAEREGKGEGEHIQLQSVDVETN